DSMIWHHLYNLISLKTSAISIFISTHYIQILNKPNTLIYQLIKNTITTEQFSHLQPHPPKNQLNQLSQVWSTCREWDPCPDLLLSLQLALIDTWQTSLTDHSNT